MNPVFLSVVPAARRRGEQGTQATAATVAWEEILVKIFHISVYDLLQRLNKWFDVPHSQLPGREWSEVWPTVGRLT